MKVKLKTRIRTGSKENISYSNIGDIVDLEDVDAKTLIKRGLADEVNSDIIQTNLEENNRDGSDEKIAEIVEAISILNEEDWTGDKKPKVDALENILEYNISADERDKAFEIYKDSIS